MEHSRRKEPLSRPRVQMLWSYAAGMPLCVWSFYLQRIPLAQLPILGFIVCTGLMDPEQFGKSESGRRLVGLGLVLIMAFCAGDGAWISPHSVAVDVLAGSIVAWYALFVILNMRMVAYEISHKQVV